MKEQMSQKLSTSFFQRHTLTVAKELLGKYLVYGICEGQIVETEAYREQDDEACHAYRRKTPRNATMFKEGGHLYVYRIHQVYCLNIVTEVSGKGCAVLIRGLEPTGGIELMRARRSPGTALADGPGKLCQAMGIDRQHDGICLTIPHAPIWIEDRRIQYTDECILKTPRIGVSKATDLLWRFVIPRDRRLL